MRKPHLKHQHIIKLGRLLDMMYKPSEIAEEIGVTMDTVYRSYLPAGLPHVRDEQGRVWIHGPAFVGWARQTISKRKTKRMPLADDQAWCMKCGRPVEMQRPQVIYQNKYLKIMQSVCPHCKTKINRAMKNRANAPSPLAVGSEELAQKARSS